MKSLNIFYITTACILMACGSEKRKQNTVERFPITSPVTLDTVYNSDYVAEIHSRQNIEIRTRVKGYLEKIYVDEGAYVKEGQVMFTISNQEYKEELLKTQAMLKSAIAEVEAAELDMQNVKSLTEKNIVSKTKLAMTKAKLEALYANADEMRSYEASAKLRLAYTEIKAPFDGIIDRLPHKAGSLVDENELLTTLSDNKEVYAYFNVSEKEYLAYSFNKKDKAEAEKITLILADNSLHPYTGTIETIEGEFDKSTGSIAFRARFPNPEGILRHGSSGKIRLKRHVKNALVIPQKATFEIQDKMYVYLLDKENKVKMQSITAKLRLPHLYVLGSGLSASDRIIYEGIQDIVVGLQIQPDKVDLRQIIPQLAKQ